MKIIADLYLQGMKVEKEVGEEEMESLVKEVIKRNRTMKLIMLRSESEEIIGTIQIRKEDIIVELDWYKGIFTIDGDTIMERKKK